MICIPCIPMILFDLPGFPDAQSVRGKKLFQKKKILRSSCFKDGPYDWSRRVDQEERSSI